MQVGVEVGRCIPFVKLINGPRVDGEDADYMGEHCLPYSQFKLMQ